MDDDVGLVTLLVRYAVFGTAVTTSVGTEQILASLLREEEDEQDE